MYAVTLPWLFFFPVKLKLAQHFLRAVLTELSVLVWQHCSALVSAEFDSGVQFACSPCACGLLSSTPTPFRRLTYVAEIGFSTSSTLNSGQMVRMSQQLEA